jgi:hypothetical protein
MPVLLYELEDIVAFGSENSSLGPMVDAAAKSVNLKLSPDPMPEEGVFIMLLRTVAIRVS